MNNDKLKMKFKIYYINRYSSPNSNEIRNHSGYEQLVKYSNLFKSGKSNKFINNLVFKFLNIEKPKDYREIKSSEELILFFKSLITGNPVFYLYADKDAFLLPLLKRKFRLKRIKLFGTLHWPWEISQEFSFYKHNLENQFDGIITLSSSLNPKVSIPTCIIPHGIDLSYWQKDSSIIWENSYLILGISNRNHKGQMEVISNIKEIDPRAKFVLLIQDENIYKQYEVFPEMEIRKERVTDDELKRLYTTSKAVILIQNHCLASNVVLECISMNTPLISNRVGDIEEYLGKDYPLFLDDNQEGDKLYNICHSIEFRQEIVEYFSHIRNKFEWNQVAEQTINFIEEGCRE